MQTTIWTYPWDVLDVGAEQALSDLLDRAGATGISLATAYHAGHFLQPRSPRRKVAFLEDGTIYFHPNHARYAKLLIKPRVASLVHERGDALRQLEEAKGRRPFRLHGWTVCLHNTRIGLEHPQVTTETAFGDRNLYNLCPSHPEARAYVTTLVGDLTERYHLEMVELESPNFMGFRHEFHHEKDGVGLTNRENFLFSLCFCEECRRRAAKAGVDADAARRTVRRWIEELCERAVPLPDDDFPAQGPDAFRTAPEVREYLLWRTEPVTSLVREIREAAHPRTQVCLLGGEPRYGWLSGADTEAVAAVSDGLVMVAYEKDGSQVAQAVDAARSVVSAGKYLSAGLRLFYPEAQGPADVSARLAGAARAGADGVNIYNYGLVPAARLDWVRAAVNSLPQ